MKRITNSEELRKAKIELEEAKATKAEAERQAAGSQNLYKGALQALGQQMTVKGANLTPTADQAARAFVMQQAAAYAVDYATRKVEALEKLIDDWEKES